MKRIFFIFSILFAVAACDSSIDDPENGQQPGKPGTEEGPGEKPQEPVYSYFYQEVTESRADWTGEYLITYKSGNDIKVFAAWDDNAYGQPAAGVNIAEMMTDNGVPAEKGDPYKSVVAKDGDFYSISVSNVGFIGHDPSTKNTLLASQTIPSESVKNYQWNISYKSGIWLRLANEDNNRRLQWNNNPPRFSTYTGSQEEVTLYRKVAVSEGGDVTDPDKPGGGDITGPDKPVDPKPEPEPEPEIPGGGESLPNNAKYGWYELPVMNVSSSGNYIIDSRDKNLYFAHHLCAGNEQGPNGTKARNYTVCFSAEHHCPVWVAAPRHAMYENGNAGRMGYSVDPSIPADIQYHSKSTGGGCNKGHMLGSAERQSSKPTNKQVFYYTNIAPQLQSSFNTGGGGWNTLEDWVDTQVCSDTLYVVIGTYFDKYTDNRGISCNPKKISFGGRNDVSFPTMFYYILLRTKSGKSGKALSECSSSELKCAAFVRSHNTGSGVRVSKDDLMSVSDLEKVTGFTYFANVPQAPKSSCNASDWGL